MTETDLIEFENWTKSEWESGNLPCLLHLCGGNEERLIELWKEINPGDWIFSTHRNHYHALLAGIHPDILKAKIMGGDSMFVYSSLSNEPTWAHPRKHNFCCSAVLAGCCGIAAGVAWAIKDDLHGPGEDDTGGNSTEPVPLQKVWCFIGDGGEEEGHFYEAAMFVEANGLPCTFIIEDNDRSVDTPRTARRGNAKGLEHLFKCVRRYHYTPTYPHAGSGCTFQIKFKPEAIERLKSR